MNDEPLFELTVYPAHNGDAFLLRLNKTNILIDGGYVDTFNRFIKKDLEEIAAQGESLSYVIVTHIDQDHISGIIKLFESLSENKWIEINNIWHNSYRHISGKKRNNSDQKDHSVSELIQGSYLKEVNEDEKEISGKQGSTLASLLLQGEYRWNAECNEQAISIENLRQVVIDQETTIILLSPNNEKLEKLEKFWRKELRKFGYFKTPEDHLYYDDAFEFILARQREAKRAKPQNVSKGLPKIDNLLQVSFEEDQTAPNGSSIAFIIEHKGKKLLFLGDSHPSLIMQELEYLYPKECFPIKFDLIKVSHHGSWSNTNPEILKIIDSDKFIFSTNGKGHNHPDQETIAQIVARKSNFNRAIYSNYTTASIVNFDHEELEKSFGYKIIKGDGNSRIIINLNDE